MIKIILAGLILLVTINLKAQHGDCPNAIPICSDIYTYFNAATGIGSISEAQTGCLFGENNTTWFVFTAQTSGPVGFGITTQSGQQEDYDWGVWDITANGCAQVITDLPISCNSAQLNALTGPTGGSSQTTGGPGPGNPENALMNVIGGNTYAIMIDNWFGTNTGFTVDFATYSPTTIYDTVTPKLTKARLLTCGSNKIEIEFSENVICSGVNPSDFVVTGPGGSYNVIGINSPNCGNPIGTGLYNQDNSFNLIMNQNITTGGIYNISLNVDSLTDLCGNYNNQFSFDFEIAQVEFTGLPDTTCPEIAYALQNIGGLTAPCLYIKAYTSANNLFTNFTLQENGIDKWGAQSISPGAQQTFTFSNLNPNLSQQLSITSASKKTHQSSSIMVLLRD